MALWEKGMNRHVDKVLCTVDSKNGAITSSIPPSHIDGSWERCLTKYNLDPSSKNKPRILTKNALREYQEPLEEFLLIAKSGMKNFYEKISPAGYVILLGDSNGVTIDYMGDPRYEQEHRDAGLYLGSVWAEAIEGTCGMGTCIEERRAITIHRDEHFRARHIGLSCSTTPLFLPDGELLGTLDISLLRPPENKNSQLLALQLVDYYARLIENAYFLRLYKNSWIIRFNYMQAFVEVITENILAINAEGRVIAANERAKQGLGTEVINKHVSDVFDMSFDDLMNHALHKTTTILPVRSIEAGYLYYATFRAPEINAVRLAAKKESIGKPSQTKPGASSRLTLEYLAGSDPRMIQNVSCAKRVMNKDISLILIGETGTGKEVFARAVHQASDRAARPFVALNCASIPESLIESELFGYKQGAFTGAHSKGMRGKILQSDGGTLFLDEIGDMPLNLQTRLLRVLAEKEIQPLGSESVIKVDLNIICATLRNLEELVRDKQFREDLYYRLNGVTIKLPSVRERRDKALLIKNVLAVETGHDDGISLGPEALDVLMKFPWPGNIRQLRNVLRFAIAINEGGVIGVDDLPPELLTEAIHSEEDRFPGDHDECIAHETVQGDAELTFQDSDERDELQQILKKNKWNITDASRELGISRSTLYRKMDKYRLIPPNEM